MLNEEFKIDPQFHSLIPPLTEDELNGLEQSLLDEGCRDPLVLWDDILLDGHNRYEICQKHDIKFKTISKGFDDRDQAKIWIINNQLARRNLSPEQMSNLRGMRYNLEKKETGHPENQLGQNVPIERTSEKLAKEYGVSERTIRRDAKFAEAVDKLSPEEKKEVLSGKSGRTKKEIIKPLKTEKRKLGPPCQAMQFARLAILDLEKIHPKDIERTQAFSCVKGWIHEHEK